MMVQHLDPWLMARTSLNALPPHISTAYERMAGPERARAIRMLLIGLPTVTERVDMLASIAAEIIDKSEEEYPL